RKEGKSARLTDAGYDQNSLCLLNCGVKCWRSTTKLPPASFPPSPIRVVSKLHALGPYLRLDDCHKFRPPLSTFFLVPHPKVDHVAMVRMRGTGVYLLAANVREDDFLAFRVFLQNPMHL